VAVLGVYRINICAQFLESKCPSIYLLYELNTARTFENDWPSRSFLCSSLVGPLPELTLVSPPLEFKESDKESPLPELKESDKDRFDGTRGSAASTVSWCLV
jgi:hypothetical protein